ncbi:MFS general substrate transporter, partial [Auricularia subglabra TFB-10046 SS5]
QTIVSTALPRIVSQFNGLSQVTWVVSAYLLTQAGFMLTGGQLLTIVPTKIIFLLAISVFEIGSLICAVASSMEVLIFGRAFAGLGAACMSHRGKRLSGVLTSVGSWRWCFYINLPFGGLAIATVSLFLRSHKTRVKPGTEHLTQREKWKKVDIVGSFLCLGMVTSLLLPLQWGGNTKPWNDKVVIALFCVFGVLLAMFVAWEARMGENAILPFSLIGQAAQLGICIEAFFIMVAMLLVVYYLPLWYQAQGHTATQSGIGSAPVSLTTVLVAMLTGVVINFTGRYWPWLVVSPLLISVGSGLLYTIDESTANAKVIGYQILMGVGAGGAIQNVLIAVQAEHADQEHMVPQATATVTWTQLLGGIIGIACVDPVYPV